MKSFSQYITEETKSVVFTFGRFNPPTVGHEKLINKLASLAKGNNYRVYASQSQDAKKNPLSHTDKVKFLRKMFPKHGRAIMADKDVKTVFDILTKLYDQGFNDVTMVVGSDRVPEFNALTKKYNGVKGRHGFYNFDGGVKIVSAGQRDPDAEGVEGMSASKMRAAVSDGDYTLFTKGLPAGFKGGQDLFNAVRKGMGLKESHDFRLDIKLETVSEAREAFVHGDLFAEGDMVVVKESQEVCRVKHLGSNYVIVESGDKQYRKWITDVEKLEEEKQEEEVIAQVTESKTLKGFSDWKENDNA